MFLSCSNTFGKTENLDTIVQRAGKGEAQAQYELAIKYLNEPQPNSNLTDIADWLKQAAEQGHAKAQYELGKMYREGSGVLENLTKAIDWFQKAAEQGFAKAQFRLGMAHQMNALDLELDSIVYHKRDAYKDKINKIKEQASRCCRLAYPDIQQLGESGDAEAQFILSRMFMGAYPVIKDEDKGVEWQRKAIENFERIAKSGSIEAQRSLGEIYLFAQNNIEKIKWYTKAANQGDAISQYQLGSHYKVLAKDYTKAIIWLKKAAQQGHIQAQYELGQIFDNRALAPSSGNEIKAFHNDVEAVKWYTKAAEQGHMEAQYCLGEKYEFVKEVQDYDKAVKWYTKAAEQGHFDAQVNLGQMYASGDFGLMRASGEKIPKNYEKAIKWYEKAAEQEQKDLRITLACLDIGRICYERKDYKKAIKWFKRSAERGDRSAQYELGKMYFKGEGVELNLNSSARWYQKAAESGYDLAQYCLGLMYFKGEGVIQDYVEAYKWANLAASKSSCFAGLRDNIKKEMSSEQIAEGQKKAKEFENAQQRKIQMLRKKLF